MKKILFFFFVFICLTHDLTGQNFTPLISLHQNNSSGQPVLSQSVTISGSVISRGTALLGLDFNEYFLQDSTGGILMLSKENFQVGDSLQISGQPGQRFGLTTLQAETVIRIGSVQPPQPLVLTCIDVRQAFQPDFSEPNESRLIQINNVTSRNTSPWYTLLDASGSCKLFLDPATKVSAPSGAFSIVGILIQKDETSPFTENYFILPRASEDIVYAGAPKIKVLPKESDVQSNQVTIGWETSNQSSSILEFGRTTQYELGRIGDSARVQIHQVTLGGLQPAAIYHCRAISVNAAGAVRSKNLLFSTASRPESQGIIRVYFTRSVDRLVATGTVANGPVNLKNKIVDRIKAAQYTIDLAVYTLTLDEVTSALIAAKKRGVSIRFITEEENRGADIQSLIQAGIPVIDDKFGANSGNGYMHNKFAIFDAREKSSAADDWVWTGSANFSYNGTSDNAENAVEIQDEALAQCYTIEFNEMWGSATDTPDPNQSRFGPLKTENTPHVFNINGMKVEQYMSHGDLVINQLYKIVESAEYSIHFCIYGFTVEALSSRMRQQRERFPGLKLQGVFDYVQSGQDLCQYYNMTQKWQPPADVWCWRSSTLLHNKYLLIDAEKPAAEPIVLTGSYNWSNSAENNNDENILIFHDAKIANYYYQEFRARYKEAGGTAQVNSLQNEAVAFQLNQNYPNPFNLSTVISYSLDLPGEVSLQIFNPQGELVHAVFEDFQTEGFHQIKWNGTNAAEQIVSSGIYYFRLTVNQKKSQTGKMVFLR